MKKSKSYIFKVPDDFQGKIRLSEFVIGLFPYLETGSAVKKAIKKKHIKLNGDVGYSGDWVTAGSTISYEFFYTVTELANKTIETFYEDQDLLVVRKPPGISSSGNTRSLQYDLQSIVVDDGVDALPYPYLVHRLDRATEGLLIAAKTMKSRRVLATMLELHSIIKEYVLIVGGKLDVSLKWITSDIDDKPAKTEILNSVLLDTKDITTKVFVRLHTGRTHQIRKHFREIGHPLVGDSIYNSEGLTFGTGLLLCACYLEFIHPITQELIKVEYPTPLKISKYKHI